MNNHPKSLTTAKTTEPFSLTTHKTTEPVSFATAKTAEPFSQAIAKTTESLITTSSQSTEVRSSTNAPHVEPLTPAEMAMLQFWHEYVRRYSPGACRYVPDVHCINRTKLFYLMTEDLIEHYKTSGVPCYSSRAGQLMGVSVGSLKNWRDNWGRLWRRLRLK